MIPHTYNIGSEEDPVLINLKKVGMWRKIPRQDGWELFDTVSPTGKDIPTRITDEQYEAISAMILEKEMREADKEMREQEMEGPRRMALVDVFPRR